MKKIYVTPEFELLKLRLQGEVLVTTSIESGQSSSAGSSIDDPPLDPVDDLLD